MEELFESYLTKKKVGNEASKWESTKTMSETWI